jgi:hypothetical protein
MVQFVGNEDSSVSFTICSVSRGMAISRRRKKGDSRLVPAVVMPKLEELEFIVVVEELIRNNVTCEDLGLEYLLSIRKGVEVPVLMTSGDIRLH